MSKMNESDKRDFRLLQSFVDHLERREDSSGWTIIHTPSYETTNFRKSNSKSRPPEGMKQVFKIYAEWKEMGQNDLEFEIDRFLDKNEI